jgi:hypothetical protein
MKKELPVNIVAKAGSAIRLVCGPLAEAAARETGVVVRRRKFTPRTLARVFVLGFLQKPAATDEDLARVAAQCGAGVTPQAVDQRHTPKLAAFLEALFRRAVRVVVGSDRPLAPLLERFTQVTVLDSTSIALPDGMRGSFPGCGGSHGGGAAAVKLQTELDLRTGALSYVGVEPGRGGDGQAARQHAPRPAGSLRITDLGYFSVAVFAAIQAAGAHFLSRLHYKTGVRSADGRRLAVPRGLAGFFDGPVLLGPERLACRLIAWRLPREQADRRRRKLRRQMLSKEGRAPSAERLAWCDWTILVTSAPAALLSAGEAVVLYRARWQVELLFKRWKSQGLAAALGGSTEARQVVRVWARLLAALVQHWLVVTAAWGDPARSWAKTAEAVRSFVGRLLWALDRPATLDEVIRTIRVTASATCRRNNRRKPGTIELLYDPSRLNFRRT